jgi:hypothetical protein
VERFKQLLENVQELILKKLHRGTKVRHIQHKTLTIDALKLSNYKRWLPIIVCLLALISIKKITTTYHNISSFDRK